MSLIQEALEKTSRIEDAKGEKVLGTFQALSRESMGLELEKELAEIQQAYAQKRKFYWRIAWVVLGLIVLGGLWSVYAGASNVFWRAKVSSPVTVSALRSPIKIFSGTLYRLTGITSINGRPLAVINEQIVGVGDALSGSTVVKAIEKGRVRLDVQGREMSLVL